MQLGKHFWPNFSFVQGVRVDYLSPTLYLTDIFLCLLIVFSFIRLRSRLINVIKRPLFVFLLLILMVGALFSKQPAASFFGIAKLLELGYLSFYISFSFTNKDVPKLMFSFILGGLVEVVILVFQFISQGSLGGAFYYLGERSFDASTHGIALFRWGESLILRPYGTFPHPNVLACYLLFGFTFLLFSKKPKRSFPTLIIGIVLTLLAIGIILTFSRVIICLLVAVVLFWVATNFRNKAKNMWGYIGLGMVTLMLFIILYPRFEGSFLRDLILRLDLFRIAWEIFVNNPIFGVGLNNFFYHEVSLQKDMTPILLQPIHNIYALWLVQTGIFGMIVFLFFVKQLKNLGRVISVLLFSFAFIGMFDHYLITLQQGQLLLAILFGLSLSSFAKNMVRSNSSQL